MTVLQATHRILGGQAKGKNWLPPGAGLRLGTSLERISDESVTPADSGFVRRYM
jgi:hypothetical protein